MFAKEDAQDDAERPFGQGKRELCDVVSKSLDNGMTLSSAAASDGETVGRS